MKRFPAVVGLAGEIRGGGKNSPQKSADYLLRNRVELQTYPSVDVLAMFSDPEYAPSTATPDDIKGAKALVHHLTQVRSAIARALWSREFSLASTSSMSSRSMAPRTTTSRTSSSSA